LKSKSCASNTVDATHGTTAGQLTSTATDLYNGNISNWVMAFADATYTDVIEHYYVVTIHTVDNNPAKFQPVINGRFKNIQSALGVPYYYVSQGATVWNDPEARKYPGGNFTTISVETRTVRTTKTTKVQDRRVKVPCH
jgi:hypothetical protein